MTEPHHHLLSLTALALLALAPPVAAMDMDGRVPAATPWAAVAGPSAGPPRVIGTPADGCLSGAAVLPPDGPGYEAIRLSRRRNFGHPDTIAFVARLGRAAAAAGLPLVYVGDMAQPRGGPMVSGHSAHQNGLDVDIWFTLVSRPRRPVAEREDLSLPSMLQPGGTAVDLHRFGSRQVTLLRLAAADPRVDRIFVNPAIKLALCRGLAGRGEAKRTWLHKIRPWWGHDEHFHVRLRCPPDSPDCRSQASIPPGAGCGARLAWWFTPHPAAPAVRPPTKPPLPLQCRAVLAAR